MKQRNSSGTVYRTLERAVAGGTAALERAFNAEEYASRSGFLQRLDTRTKIVTCLAFLLAAALSRNLLVLVGLYVFALLLAWLSKLPMGTLLRRVWLAVLIFTAVIALPAIFNVVTPGKDVLVLLDVPQGQVPAGWPLPHHLSLTQQGLASAAFLILRVSTSVSFALTLVLTTRWHALLRGLRVLAVPKMAVFLLGMTHRYIYLLLSSMGSMFVARKSRTVGPLSATDTRRWLTSSMGVMLGRSYQLSSEVHLAMISRGFSGDIRMLEPARFHTVDFVYLPLALLLAAGAGVAGVMLPIVW